MAEVVLDSINKVHGDSFHAIHDLSFDVRDGAFMVFVGPSGCGKSTALRATAHAPPPAQLNGLLRSRIGRSKTLASATPSFPNSN